MAHTLQKLAYFQTDYLISGFLPRPRELVAAYGHLAWLQRSDADASTRLLVRCLASGEELSMSSTSRSLRAAPCISDAPAAADYIQASKRKNESRPPGLYPSAGPHVALDTAAVNASAVQLWDSLSPLHKVACLHGCRRAVVTPDLLSALLNLPRAEESLPLGYFLMGTGKGQVWACPMDVASNHHHDNLDHNHHDHLDHSDHHPRPSTAAAVVAAAGCQASESKPPMLREITNASARVGGAVGAAVKEAGGTSEHMRESWGRPRSEAPPTHGPRTLPSTSQAHQGTQQRERLPPEPRTLLFDLEQPIAALLPFRSSGALGAGCSSADASVASITTHDSMLLVGSSGRVVSLTPRGDLSRLPAAGFDVMHSFMRLIGNGGKHGGPGSDCSVSSRQANRLSVDDWQAQLQDGEHVEGAHLEPSQSGILALLTSMGRVLLCLTAKGRAGEGDLDSWTSKRPGDHQNKSPKKSVERLKVLQACLPSAATCIAWESQAQAGEGVLLCTTAIGTLLSVKVKLDGCNMEMLQSIATGAGTDRNSGHRSSLVLKSELDAALSGLAHVDTAASKSRADMETLSSSLEAASSDLKLLRHLQTRQKQQLKAVAVGVGASGGDPSRTVHNSIQSSVQGTLLSFGESSGGRDVAQLTSMVSQVEIPLVDYPHSRRAAHAGGVSASRLPAAGWLQLYLVRELPSIRGRSKAGSGAVAPILLQQQFFSLAHLIHLPQPLGRFVPLPTAVQRVRGSSFGLAPQATFAIRMPVFLNLAQPTHRPSLPLGARPHLGGDSGARENGAQARGNIAGPRRDGAEARGNIAGAREHGVGARDHVGEDEHAKGALAVLDLVQRWALKGLLQAREHSSSRGHSSAASVATRQRNTYTQRAITHPGGGRVTYSRHLTLGQEPACVNITLSTEVESALGGGAVHPGPPPQSRADVLLSSSQPLLLHSLHHSLVADLSTHLRLRIALTPGPSFQAASFMPTALSQLRVLRQHISDMKEELQKLSMAKLELSMSIDAPLQGHWGGTAAEHQDKPHGAWGGKQSQHQGEHRQLKETALPASFCDGKVRGLYPNPNSCSMSALCVFGSVFELKCGVCRSLLRSDLCMGSPTLYFNPDVGYCDWPRNVESCSSQAALNSPLEPSSPPPMEPLAPFRDISIPSPVELSSPPLMEPLAPSRDISIPSPMELSSPPPMETLSPPMGSLYLPPMAYELDNILDELLKDSDNQPPPLFDWLQSPGYGGERQNTPTYPGTRQNTPTYPGTRQNTPTYPGTRQIIPTYPGN
eukprot:gene15236-21318_t